MEEIMCDKGDFVQYGLAKAVTFLQSDPNGKCFIIDITWFEFIMINILGGDNNTINEGKETETDRLRAVVMTAMSTPVGTDDESRLLGTKQPALLLSNLQPTRAAMRRLRRKAIGEAIDV